jgi:hypothetical protein
MVSAKHYIDCIGFANRSVCVARMYYDQFQNVSVIHIKLIYCIIIIKFIS